MELHISVKIFRVSLFLLHSLSASSIILCLKHISGINDIMLGMSYTTVSKQLNNFLFQPLCINTKLYYTPIKDSELQRLGPPLSDYLIYTNDI